MFRSIIIITVAILAQDNLPALTLSLYATLYQALSELMAPSTEHANVGIMPEKEVEQRLSELIRKFYKTNTPSGKF